MEKCKDGENGQIGGRDGEVQRRQEWIGIWSTPTG